jgi:hypothetical protein
MAGFDLSRALSEDARTGDNAEVYPMTLKRTYWLGLMMSAAVLFGCSSEDPSYQDASLPSGAGGTLSGVGGTTAGTTGGTTSGTAGTVGGTVAGTVGGTTGGTLPGTVGGTTGGTRPGTVGGTTAGTTPGTTAGTMGDAGDAGTPGAGDGGTSEGGTTSPEGGTAPSGMGCTPAPTGTFQAMMVANTGPGGNYTIHRPATLGANGFLHPPVAWGNGLATVPSDYTETLNKLASNGFVVIANPGTGSDPQVVRQGLEWLLMQNASGAFMGKLAVNCAGTIGYSMGGGAAVGSGAHPAVKAVVSIHGLQDAAENVKGPLLLTTSTGDEFVTKAGFVQPCYDRSRTQPTMMITHAPNGAVAIFGDHLEPLGGGGHDTEPAIAWLRLWLYGDEAQKPWFYGANCKTCTAPWMAPARKNHKWD